MGWPEYDTSYVSHRQVTKNCLISYWGNRYSVPYVYARKAVAVCETLDGGILCIFHQHDRIAGHRLATGKGAMVMEAAHCGSLPRKNRAVVVAVTEPVHELVPGPGVGLQEGPDPDRRAGSRRRRAIRLPALIRNLNLTNCGNFKRPDPGIFHQAPLTITVGFLAGKEFQVKTTAPNQLWQSDASYYFG